MALLVIEDLYVNYGHIAALKGINLQVAEGDCHPVGGQWCRQIDHLACHFEFDQT